MVVDRGHSRNGEILDNMMIVSAVALSRKMQRSSHPIVEYADLTHHTGDVNVLEHVYGVGGAPVV